MKRSELMELANALRDDWVAMENEWIESNPSRHVEWDSKSNGIGHTVSNGAWKKEIPVEFTKKTSALIDALCEHFAPKDLVATDEVRSFMRQSDLSSFDWENCDDKIFPIFAFRYFTKTFGIPIKTRDENIKDSWVRFSETFGGLISDAMRSPPASVEYHRGIANLKEWRDGGCK